MTLPDPALEQIDHLRPRDLALGLCTYNNAETVTSVLEAARAGLRQSLQDARVVVINADAGSTDTTRDLVAGSDLPVVGLQHEAPLGERMAVPFHGVPGRGAGLRTIFTAAQRLGVRVLVLLEPDLTSVTPEWIDRLAGPIWAEKADFVAPAYARHRYDGTITNLLLSPLVRALYGRRLRQPLGGQQALSGRLLEHLLLHPKSTWNGRAVTDLWVVGTAIADGFSVWEAWLGPRTVRSHARTTDLPAMIAQTLGSVFDLMDRHEDLWLEVRGSEPLLAVGEPMLPSAAPVPVDVDRMIDAFRLGLRDLTTIWEQILAPETLGEVLGLAAIDGARFTFPDDLWARVVYDFALGHHYNVVYRDHLLRSLVPLYLGRTAAFVIATRQRTAAASDQRLDAVGAAFERHKPYLVERWR